MSRAVQVEKLVKRYGATTAVDGISFAVERGEIFGMVGPNGAGKTTTIECVEGLRRPDGGRVRVLGHDPAAEPRELRERVGVQLQESALSPRIKVWEALDLFASFYPARVEWRPLLSELGLAACSGAQVATLSGGQRQRLFIALALVNDPELVFLDELTTGLDPHARRSIWELVLGIRERGKTVCLTTHFMEEAERLCDRVAIVDRGRIVALDTPRALIRSLDGGTRLVMTVGGSPDLEPLRRLEGVSRVCHRGGRLEIEGARDGLASRAVRALAEQGVEVRDLGTVQATLEDVFLAVTGRRIEEGA
ncbi:MAG: ABC transporter ATP-binding protein [Thermoanaerobaculia bacterium]|nr:ABC transporter ATP-binding protein [Thermoanaerobaculia bacterium]